MPRFKRWMISRQSNVRQWLRIFGTLCWMFALALPLSAQAIRGRVIDAETGEGLLGAAIKVKETNQALTTDEEGRFQVKRPRKGQSLHLTFNYISYAKEERTLDSQHPDTLLIVPMRLADNLLGVATVTGKAARNSETAMVSIQRNSLVVQSGISAQQIQRSQDKDASEVIRRVPGISIIDQKFVMVRGLSQRYNNVWINGSAVPSSEADTRAFSFDIIPSSQVNNLQIIKSPAPQYPADFSGGFILIDTKEVPSENAARISISGAMNDRTHVQSFLMDGASATDFLGFDSGKRGLNGGMSARLNTFSGGGINLLGNGFNNDWVAKNRHPWADLGLSADVNHSWSPENGSVLSLLASLNYSNAYRSYAPMTNSLYGAYDLEHDASVFLRKNTDRQYNHDARLGGLLNLTWVPAKGKGRYEWKNIINQLGKQRYTEREGFNAQSNQIRGAEYYYSSRTTYNTQLTGKYILDRTRWNWNAGYAYANRLLPDRRRYTLDNALDPNRIGLTTGNDISREFTRLDEHILSAAGDMRLQVGGSEKVELLAGLYGEYRTRTYRTRSFIYGWDARGASLLPADFRYLDVAAELMQPNHYGNEGLYLIDDTHMRNDYDGHHLITSAYAAARFTLGTLDLFAGLRFEHSRMELVSNTRDYERSPQSTFYDGNDVFPSLNAVWRYSKEHQLRLCYGRSINRPEFREVSSSVFYDFDLASSVQGNTELQACHVDNIDLRYEWYMGGEQAKGDQVSLAAFYKHFDAPIEWTYTVAGGTDLIYSYQNARQAHSYGLELDLRKGLGFIGLPDWSIVFNGSLIKSRVRFAEGSRQKDRPMQGQSPYLVNAGLFYQHKAWTATILYNIIGKRLIGVGRSLGSTGDQTVNIPDSYEMPRHSLDLSFGHDFGPLQLRISGKDIVGQAVCFKQFNSVTKADGTTKEVEEVTRRYRPGRTFSVALSWKF